MNLVSVSILVAVSIIAMPFMAAVLAKSLYAVHCLKPTHPGALAAAGIIDVNVGNLIIAGTLFAVPAALSAWFWSRLMIRKKNYKPVPEIISGKEETMDNLPSALMSFLPIVIPLLLISIKSLVLLFDKEHISLIYRIFRFPGEPVFALAIGAGIGLFLIKKTAQGSSTVAIITSASFVFPMLQMLGLDSETGRIFTMLSMGAGSMFVSHANDSYFWVISRFYDLDLNTTLRVYSSLTFVMGIVVFIFIWIASLFLL